MTADNDRIFEKVSLSHPDQTIHFFHLLCPSWTACVTYNIYLNTRSSNTPKQFVHLLVCCSDHFTECDEDLFVRIAVKCQLHTHRT